MAGAVRIAGGYTRAEPLVRGYQEDNFLGAGKAIQNPLRDDVATDVSRRYESDSDRAIMNDDGDIYYRELFEPALEPTLG
jgi:hypothetical protein